MDGPECPPFYSYLIPDLANDAGEDQQADRRRHHARAKEIWLWDETLAGFGLRVTPSGKNIYVAQFRAGGRVRRIKLGAHGALTPDQARLAAAAASEA